MSKRLISHWGYHVEYQYLFLQVRTLCQQILQDQSIGRISEELSKKLKAHTFEKPCLKLVYSCKYKNLRISQLGRLEK